MGLCKLINKLLFGFIDTMAVFDRFGYQAQETQAFVNPFAAVPSLHFGWSMLIGVVVAWVGRKHRLLLLLGIIWPIAMFFAVVVTGNHFILDAVAGAVVCVVGIGLAVFVYSIQPYIKQLLLNVWLYFKRHITV